MSLSSFHRRVRQACALLGLGALALSAQGQTFKLDCDAEGLIPQLDNKKLTPAKVSIELQTIGRHVYFNMVGPADYQMRVSSLITEHFLGANLTSATRLGAHKTNKDNGQENQLVIERSSAAFSGYNDALHSGRLVRVFYEGKCKLPS